MKLSCAYCKCMKEHIVCRKSCCCRKDTQLSVIDICTGVEDTLAAMRSVIVVEDTGPVRWRWSVKENTVRRNGASRGDDDGFVLCTSKIRNCVNEKVSIWKSCKNSS